MVGESTGWQILGPSVEKAGGASRLFCGFGFWALSLFCCFLFRPFWFVNSCWPCVSLYVCVLVGIKSFPL